MIKLSVSPLRLSSAPQGVFVPVVPPAVTLSALSLSSTTATVGSAFSATISGLTSGSSLSLAGAGAAGLSISGATLSGTPTAAGTVDLVETLAGATNSPRTTSGALSVAAAVTLSALSLSPASATVGSAYSGSISGATSGSTLSLSGAGSAGLSISGTTVSGTPSATGPVNLVETLSGATNSPNTSTGVLSVSITLSPLTLSVTSATVGTAYSASITGKTSGSSLSLTGSGSAGLSISGTTVSGTPTATGAVNLVETLSGATNSPNTSAGVLTVITAAVPSLRHIASRTYIPNTKDGSSRTQIMSRTGQQNRAGQPVSALMLGIPNWYATTGGSGEVSSGGTATFTASIEYPAGTFNQVTFSNGATSITAAANTTAMSDMVALTQSIPDDATFWVNIYGVFSSAIVHTFKFSAANGDKARYGTSGVVDSTMATFTSNASVTLHPVLIVGVGVKAATLILGDSRCYGTGGTNPETGEIEPSLNAASLPYCNAGIFGSQASQSTTGRRQEMAVFFQNIVFELGINDITAGTSLSTYQGTLANIRARSGFSGKPMILTTKPPVSTSTDNWLTTSNQTTHSSNAVRVAVNDWIRTNPYGTGYFEIADVVESARNSGLWAADGVTAKKYNSDGTHENDAGYEAIRTSGAINLALLTNANDNLYPVASRLFFPNDVPDSNAKSVFAQTRHLLYDDITGTIRIQWPNIRATTGNGTNGGANEIKPGAAATATANITYIHRTLKQTITINMVDRVTGSTTLTAPNGGFFDAVAVITAGKGDFVQPKIAATFPNGAYLSQGQADYAGGDLIQWGTSAFTLSNTPSNTYTGSQHYYGPCSIRSETAIGSWGVVGDSRNAPLRDVANDIYGNIGQVGRLVGQRLPVINVSVPGELAADFAISSQSPVRRALVGQARSGGFVMLGTNDIIFNGRSSAATKSLLDGIANDLGWATTGIYGTLDPASSDAGNTALARPGAPETQRLAFNSTIRGVTRRFDPASALEAGGSSSPTGLWASASYQTDGTHESNVGNAYAAANSGFDFSLIGSPAIVSAGFQYTGTPLYQSLDLGTWSSGDVTTDKRVLYSPEHRITAARVIENTTANQHQVYFQPAITMASGSHTLKLFAKRVSGSRNLRLEIYKSDFSTNIVTAFNLGTGALIFNGTPGATFTATSGTSSAFEDWYQLTVTFTLSAALTNSYLILNMGDASGTNGYTGDGTSGIALWGIDIR